MGHQIMWFKWHAGPKLKEKNKVNWDIPFLNKIWNGYCPWHLSTKFIGSKMRKVDYKKEKQDRKISKIFVRKLSKWINIINCGVNV